VPSSDSILADLRFGACALLRAPGFALTVILSLAIGLAAAAGAVSLLDAFGLRPPAVADPDRLIRLHAITRAGARQEMPYRDYEAFRDRVRVFDGLSAFAGGGAGLTGHDGVPEVILIASVSADYFRTLGVVPVLGRPFAEHDDEPGAPPSVVLSYRLWQRRFHGDPDIVHHTVELYGRPCHVIGIAPRAFTGIDATVAIDAWLPFVSSGQRSGSGPSPLQSVRVVGRLKTGITPIQAQADVDAIAAGLSRDSPATNHDVKTRVITEAERLAGIRRVGLLLWAIVILVLVIGCANVAGLLIGRAEGRKQEMAIRVALGASRRRLLRQLLTESLMLAVLALLAALVLAFWIVRALPTLLPPTTIPIGFDFRLDVHAVVVMVLAALATAVVFGLWPALAASRPAIASAARLDSSTGGRARFSGRNLLVIGQVALSLPLLIGSALLVQSVRNSAAIDLGFERRPLLLVTLVPSVVGHTGARTQAFFRTVVERLSDAPGVEAVSLTRRVPLDPNGGGAARDVTLPDRPSATNAAPLRVKFNSVASNYFDVMGTRIERGRGFADGISAQDPKVVVVNETFARRFWTKDTAVGQRIRVDGADDYTIVGVAEDGKYLHLAEKPEPYLFFALIQVTSAEPTVIVRYTGDAAAMATTIRRVVHDIDPRVPLLRILTLDELLRYASFEGRLAAMVVSALGSVGLLLALIGLYGMMTFAVARRTREIAIRLALGATRRDVWRDVIRVATALTTIGIACGMALTLPAMEAFSGSFYGVSATDPVTYASTVAALAGAALGASWWPARKAMRINAISALKVD
jgi:predicted permease